MGLFRPSKKKIDSTIKKEVNSALSDLLNTVGTSKFNKCKQAKPGIIYGFAFGVASHTWEVLHNHKPDWKDYGYMFNMLDDMLNIDKGDYGEFDLIGWNYQQGKYHNKDFGSLQEMLSKINTSGLFY